MGAGDGFGNMIRSSSRGRFWERGRFWYGPAAGLGAREGLVVQQLRRKLPQNLQRNWGREESERARGEGGGREGGREGTRGHGAESEGRVRKAEAGSQAARQGRGREALGFRVHDLLCRVQDLG